MDNNIIIPACKPRDRNELIMLAIGGRPILTGIFQLWKNFNEDYSLAKSRERDKIWSWEDDYYNFKENYYFYAWTDDEYEDMKDSISYDPYDKKICEILFKELQKVVYYWLSVENGKFQYYGNKIKKASLRLSEFLSQRRQSLLDSLRERMSVAFLQDCCNHISQAFGTYNVTGEIYLSRLIGYVADMAKSSKLISMR